MFLVLPAALTARPLVYEENVGQSASKVLFFAQADGYSLHLTPEGAVFLFPFSKIRLRIDSAQIQPFGCFPEVRHYLVGRPELWRTGIKSYRGVRYAGVARGVDILFGAEDDRVSWQYVFSKEAVSADTMVAFDGAYSLRVESSGDLLIDTGTESIRVARPVAFQTIHGERRLAEAAYAIAGPGWVRLHSTWPDRSQPLVIDPVLSPVTTLGGSSADMIYSVASSPDGGAYLAGETRSVDFPGATGTMPSGSNSQILLIKLNAAREIEYTVVAGGTGDDAAYGVAIDPHGEVHLTGRTSSFDFPVTSGAQQPMKGGSWDGFYLALSADGRSVRTATYLGGTAEDKGQAIALDRQGFVYMAGSTSSDDFHATTGKRRGLSDAFVIKLNPKTARAQYSVLLSGSGEEYAGGLAVDVDGNVWITGQTNSDDLPVTGNAVQRRKRGLWDAFAAEFEGKSGRLRYATFLGGGPGPQSRGIDNGLAVAIDPRGRVWIAGETDSPVFPVTNRAFEPINSGGRKAFLVRLDHGATQLGYATYLGGNGEAIARSLRVDKNGRVIVSGTSWSDDFPATPELAREGPGGAGDVFALVFDGDRGNVVCAARLGDRIEDRDGGIAMMADGSILIAGSTLGTAKGSPSRHVFFAILRCGAKQAGLGNPDMKHAELRLVH
jgi:hypothetical protein